MEEYFERLRPSARPISKKSLASNKACLLIHGFTGRPCEYDYLATFLYKNNFSVYVPRLSGHGTSGKDFLHAKKSDWVAQIRNTYIDLKAEYEHVYVVGHSMGGLLAILLGKEFPVEKLVLLAPALIPTNKNIKIASFLSYFLESIPNYDAQTDDREDSEFYTKEYDSKFFLKQIRSLHELSKEAKKSLKTIHSPILTIVSEKDESVSLQSLEYIQKHCASNKKEHVILSLSPHTMLDGIEKKRIAELIYTFLLKEDY